MGFALAGGGVSGAGLDAELERDLTPETIAQVVKLVPDVLLGEDPPAERQMYIDYLSARVSTPRAFEAEAIRAQTTAVKALTQAPRARGPRDV